MKLPVTLLLLLSICAPMPAGASWADELKDHGLFPTTAGTAAKEHMCVLQLAGPTRIYYRQYKAARERYLFVRLTNPTSDLVDAYPTLIIQGHATGAYKDGVLRVVVPPHSTDDAMVYSDSVGPRDVFRDINSLTIGCS